MKVWSETAFGFFRFAAVFIALAGSTYCFAQDEAAGYDQPFRPQLSFSPQKNWTNDPNGLVYFQGEYHLFFQHNPFGDQWGHMSWGHAVSPDLLHWKQLPVAIPESADEMIFSGSAVVDEKNTSGLCEGGKACLIAIYTGNRGSGAAQREVQDIAVSQDRGRTWVKYAGNPVLDLQMTDFRDPNVSWNEEIKAWVMAVALPHEHQVAFYSSPDLKHWTRKSVFGPAGATGGEWECPDLVRVPGRDGKGAMWDLNVGVNPGGPQGGSGEQYFLGSFDGSIFTQSDQQGSHGWLDQGKDNYCNMNYNHLPAGEKPVIVGWMTGLQYAGKQPTSPWRGQMTVPRRVTFVRDADGLALAEEPVVAPVRVTPSQRIEKTVRAETKTIEVASGTSPMELKLDFAPGGSKRFGLRIYSDEEHWTEIAFDTEKQTFEIDRSRSGLMIAPDFAAKTVASLAEGRGFSLDLVLDWSSVSAFAQQGTLAMTDLVYPPSQQVRVLAFAEGAGASLSVKGEAWELRSIWNSASAQSTSEK